MTAVGAQTLKLCFYKVCPCLQIKIRPNSPFWSERGEEVTLCGD
jgi:hypothetical protein